MKEVLRRWLLPVLVLAAALAGVLYLPKIVVFFKWIWGLILPLVVGGGIAFVLNMLMEWYAGKLYRRVERPVLRKLLSLLTALITIIAIFAAALWIVIPELVKSFDMMIKGIPDAVASVKIALSALVIKYPQLDSAIGGMFSDENVNALNHFLSNSFGDTLSSAYKTASDTLSSAVTFLIGLMFSFYILMDKEHLGRQMRQLIYTYLPETWARRFLYICHETSLNFQAFISSQCIEALILFTMYMIVALIFRLPYSFMIAVLIGVFSLIPIFGAWIAWAIGVFLIVMVSPWKAVTFSVIFLIISQIEANFIYPRIVGTSIGLPGIWVLAAVTVGTSMFGLIGTIIAVPVAALAYTLISEYSQKKLRAHPQEIADVCTPPDWKYYNPETNAFESKPVHLENVLSTCPKEPEEPKA